MLISSVSIIVVIVMIAVLLSLLICSLMKTYHSVLLIDQFELIMSLHSNQSCNIDM